MEKKFQDMKRAMQESVTLSHIDINKKMYAFVNSAVTVGTAYILAQRKDEKDEKKGYNIISVDYTTSKKAQIQYSRIEAEALGIMWFLTKEDYYTRGAQNITI